MTGPPERQWSQQQHEERLRSQAILLTLLFLLLYVATWAQWNDTGDFLWMADAPCEYVEPIPPAPTSPGLVNPDTPSFYEWLEEQDPEFFRELQERGAINP